MSILYPAQAKIFKDETGITTSIYNIINKELIEEKSRIDSHARVLQNIQYSPSDAGCHSFMISGTISFTVEENIQSKKASELGYHNGRQCEINYNYSPKYLTNQFMNAQHLEYTLTGLIIDVNPIHDNNGYCRKLTLLIEIPRHNNKYLGNFGFTLTEQTCFYTYSIKCLPFRKHMYTSFMDFNTLLGQVWNSHHRDSLLSQFIMNITSKPKKFPTQLNSEIGNMRNLDENQKQLVNYILADYNIISCIGYAGTGKTHTICDAIDKGVGLGKRFLIITPTYRSAKTFINILSNFKLINGRLLYVTPDNKELLNENFSENFYFNKGLHQYNSYFKSNYERARLQEYQNNVITYNKLLLSPPKSWTKDNVTEITTIIQELSILETILRQMIKDYVNPNVIISTPELVLKGKVDMYENEGFNYIIMDDASHIPTTTALIILSKFPNSKLCYAGDLEQITPLSLRNHNLTKKEKVLYTPIIDLMKFNDYSINIRLCMNYRSLPRLVNLFSGLFYKGLLNPISLYDKYQGDVIKFSYIFELSNVIYGQTWKSVKVKKPFYLLDIPFDEKNKSTTNSYDIQEATGISMFLLTLFDKKLPHEDIAVICLCNNQVDNILNIYEKMSHDCFNELRKTKLSPEEFLETNSLKNRITKSFQIGTVDKFISTTVPFIILSTACCNNSLPKPVSGYLGINGIICTALTRAVKGFIIFGDSDFMTNDFFWNPLVTHMNKNQTTYAYTNWILNQICRNDSKFGLIVKEYFKNISTR